MSEAMQIKPMKIWAILNPERYIKKSTKDWSLAVYDEKKSADRQIQSVSEANNEKCFIEELELCSKLELDKYIELHNEMYALLEYLHYAAVCGGITNQETIKSIYETLEKVRGEL